MNLKSLERRIKGRHGQIIGRRSVDEEVTKLYVAFPKDSGIPKMTDLEFDDNVSIEETNHKKHDAIITYDRFW